MESALYSIYALVVFVSEISLVRCAHSFDFWYVNNSCVNTVRPHFPWSILYVCRRSVDNKALILSYPNGGRPPKKIFFSALRASFWSKNKGGAGPPGPSPAYTTVVY